MAYYIAQRHLPGITPDALAAAAGRAKQTAAEMTAEGTPVQYLRSTFIPGEETCTCLFEASSAADVEAANQRAAIPYERVVEAMHLAAADV